MSVHVSFVGRLGADPETRQVGQDSVCTMRMAVSEKRRDGEVTTWMKVSVWGRQAENCQRFLAKGRQAFVVGTLTTSTYTNRDGQQATSIDVRATSVEFVGGQGGRGESEENGAAGGGWSTGGGGGAAASAGGWGGVGGGGTWGAAAQGDGADDDPIPF